MRTPTLDTPLSTIDFAPTDLDSMIHFQCVTRTYGTHVAVRELELSVAQGEVLALLGHNGAGKARP